MKKTLLTGLVLAALSPLVFAAPDGMSGATKKASDAAQTIGNVDAITSASVVPQNLRQTVKPNGFTAGDSKAKRILFVVGDPRHESVESENLALGLGITTVERKQVVEIL